MIAIVFSNLIPPDLSTPGSVGRYVDERASPRPNALSPLLFANIRNEMKNNGLSGNEKNR
jgi:hypothetical protein